MQDNNIISIKNLLDSGQNEYVNYNGQIVISHIHDLSLFRYPCHLNALTILGCIGGEFKGTINLHDYHVTGRSILVNYPANIIQITETKDLHAFAVIVSQDFLHSLSIDVASFTTYHINEIRNNETVKLPQKEFADMVRYISLLNNALLKDNNQKNAKLIKYLTTSFLIFTELLRTNYCTVINNNNPHVSKQTSLKLDRFIELVATHHSKERELRFYADKMCITPKYLSAIVLRASGKKAIEWIADFVILEAKSMLRYSDMNVQEIARQLNFPTQSSFGKYFKTQVGVSPSEYLNDKQLL